MATGLVVAGTAAPASADYYSGGVATPRFSVQITGVNSTWNTYLKHGITAWSNTYDQSGALHH